MDIPKETIEQYLPTIEEFLTSLLLEETDIGISSYERVVNEEAVEEFNETDIYLYARDLESSSDVIVVLDQEWFGLLSSIMLGIEEKEKNEQTIELLEEFSNDLSESIAQTAEEHDFSFELDGVQVLSKEELLEELAHEEYTWAKMEIEGIADEKVRAEFLLGDPETEIEKESEQEKEVEDAEAQDPSSTLNEISSLDESEEEDEFSTLESNAEPKDGGKEEEVISARQIEFAEFSEDDDQFNGEAHSMDLLKDVELDVSVELGRIELPLGKVLQLAKGSVIELEKLAGEPVDILVNGNRIALGEVVVIDEHFGVRISSLVTTKKRLAKLKNGS
jgi:flagellar motor switch protein FliN